MLYAFDLNALDLSMYNVSQVLILNLRTRSVFVLQNKRQSSAISIKSEQSFSSCNLVKSSIASFVLLLKTKESQSIKSNCSFTSNRGPKNGYKT